MTSVHFCRKEKAGGKGRGKDRQRGKQVCNDDDDDRAVWQVLTVRTKVAVVSN